MVSDLGLGSELWAVGTDFRVGSHGQENGWCYAREGGKIKEEGRFRIELWSLTTLPEQARVTEDLLGKQRARHLHFT